MNHITLNYYPGGKSRALTMSFDDGQIFDRRLVDIFNRYGIKGTFHLNTDCLGTEGFVSADELNSLYAGHEVALHTHSHPSLAHLPAEQILWEVMENKQTLEAITGRVVCGMSYPYGTTNSAVCQVLRSAGVLYSRTVQATGAFTLPEDLLLWHPTVHFLRGTGKYTPEAVYDGSALLEIGHRFATYKESFQKLPLLYIWGHSYELENFQVWAAMEEFCARISQQEHIWFATNLEIADYLQALKRLRVSTDRTIVENPSACSVWIGVNGSPVEILPGQRKRLG